jgi:DNA-binding response OmpR family regulator
MKILVADDDPTTLAIVNATLQDLGHEPILREDGAKAWEVLLREDIPVVISDWMMPHMDGLDLCRKIRSKKSDTYIYFILLTARKRDIQALRESVAAGVDDFLTKPMDPDQIWMRLKVAERILSYQHTINNLEGMLPICSYCKRVREDDNYWEQVESYISRRTDAAFTHGICPDCYEKRIKPELEAFKHAKAQATH